MPFNIKLDCLLARRKSINQCNVRYRRPRPRMSSLAQRRVEHALVILMSCENSLTTSTMENTINKTTNPARGFKNRCEAANILDKFPGNVAETSQIRGGRNS